MNRFCEICGAPIGISAGVCQSCGVSYEAQDSEEAITVGQPRWGVINISLPSQVMEAATAVDALRTAWSLLEESSFQKLAPTQLHLIVPGCASIDLVGPYSSFKKLHGNFEGQLSIGFLDKSPSEIDDLLASIPRLA